jgi:ketosteroid isomerase-like protein
MSERNIELWRRWFEAYNERDTDAMIEYCDPQILFHSVFAVAGGGTYHGHDGMRELHQDFRDVWGDEVRLSPRPTSTSASTRSSSGCCMAAATTAGSRSKWLEPR